MFFGFLSFFYLKKYLKTTINWQIVLSGIFSGLAFFSHPNGMIFSIAGFSLLLINKKWKALIVFSIFAFFVSLFFFYDLWQPGHLQTYLYQLRNWPDNVGSN
jgi:hypothetical protein